MRRIFLIGTLLLGTLGCIDPNAPANPDRTDTIVLTVPNGASARNLTPDLLDQGLLASEWSWRLYIYRNKQDANCVKAGRHRVSPSMGMRALLQALCDAPLPEDVPFTVLEGWRARDTDAALAAAKLAEPGEYLAVVNTKSVPAPFSIASPSYEGYLFPETYGVIPDRFTVAGFVTRQLETFKERVVNAHPGLSAERLHEVVVMASMLEREEPNPSNRPLVAGILWKRIDNNWALGVDATSRYTLDDTTDRRAFLQNLRDPADPYNTRLRRGLPPTAISNPSADSIEAALAPVASPYWYYLHDHDGNLHGARDAAEHEANRKRYDVH